MIKIHPIQTGQVRVKQFQVTGQSSFISRLWQLLFTQNWTDWLPIYCFLIEHPKGLFLIDTGEISAVHDKGHLPDNIGYRGSAQYQVNRDEEIDVQLEKLGHAIGQVSAIFLTHFHSDHMDGLVHFPNTKVYASTDAVNEIMGTTGEKKGYLKANLPDDLDLIPFEFEQTDPDFGASHSMTKDNAITAIPLPGHSPGHTGYVIKTENQTYVISGDMTFDKNTLRNGIPFLIFNNKDAKECMGKLKLTMKQNKVVLLTSHDPEIGKSLE